MFEIIDITNIPAIILSDSPGLSSAIPNDGLDDTKAIQAAIDWLAEERATGFTDKVTIYIPEGVFDLAETLQVSVSDVVFEGAGQGETILQNADTFTVGTDGLPDSGTNVNSVNRDAYLFDLHQSADDIVFADMSLTGPEIHGAVFGYQISDLEIRDTELKNFAWSSIRLFNSSNVRIHGNEFIDAGGQANGTSGSVGGSLYATYLKNSEIYDNRISRSGERSSNVYGIKGRKFSNVRIHHNTINTNFSIELPFENDRFVEIDHNYFGGAVSIPKFGGGPVPRDGFTFHVHHNYFTNSYALEWARNGAEINHNVFAFDIGSDGGNLISNFGSEAAEGPTKFHNNLILNPGRGIVWNRGIYNNFSFYNNEIIANETVTPRTSGLFGFNENTDFNTINIRDNVIQLRGASRPLFRNDASYDANVFNNTLVNISDVPQLTNLDTGAPRGLVEPLFFQVGANSEFTVDGYDIRLSEYGENTAPTTGGIANITVPEGSGKIVINLSEVFADRDTAAANLSYEIAGNTSPDLFDSATINPVTDELILDYTTIGNSSSELTIKATDLGGLSVETQFMVVVDPSLLPDIESSIRIEAENFKGGTNGVEYYDTDDTNRGGAYRLNEPVDIEPTNDDGGGFNVGWIRAGEYLSFDVNVQKAGLYDVVARVATPKDGLRRLGITFGNEFQRVIEFGGTGGWQKWQDITLSGIYLGEGGQELKVDFLTGGFNLNYIDLLNLTPFYASTLHVEEE